jgi:hypothetical protein
MNIVTKTYLPVTNNVLIRFVRKSDSSIVLPDGKTAGQRILVQAVGPDVTCCVPGDEVISSVGPEMIGVDEAEKLAIIPDTYIVAIVQ